MRKAITAIETPYLSLRIDADYLSLGEIGNILIRLQAVLRVLAELGRGRGQPRFIARSIKSRRRMEILVLLSILSLNAAIPQNLAFYREVAGKVFTRFALATVALAGDRGLKAKATEGELDFALAQELLADLSPGQREKLTDFVTALTKPANRIVIGNEGLSVALAPAGPPKLI